MTGAKHAAKGIPGGAWESAEPEVQGQAWTPHVSEWTAPSRRVRDGNKRRFAERAPSGVWAGGIALVRFPALSEPPPDPASGQGRNHAGQHSCRIVHERERGLYLYGQRVGESRERHAYDRTGESGSAAVIPAHASGDDRTGQKERVCQGNGHHDEKIRNKEHTMPRLRLLRKAGEPSAEILPGAHGVTSPFTIVQRAKMSKRFIP